MCAHKHPSISIHAQTYFLISLCKWIKSYRDRERFEYMCTGDVKRIFATHLKGKEKENKI